jgi:hypothetical protein
MGDHVNSAISGCLSYASVITHALKQMRDEMLKLVGCLSTLRLPNDEVFGVLFKLLRKTVLPLKWCV